MLDTLKTDQAVIERLKAAGTRTASREQIDRERVSFIYGNLPLDSTITREQVAERLKINEGAE